MNKDRFFQSLQQLDSETISQMIRNSSTSDKVFILQVLESQKDLPFGFVSECTPVLVFSINEAKSLIKHPSWLVRQMCIESASRDPLILQIALHDESVGNRCMAIHCLSQVDSFDKNVFIPLLSDVSWEVRQEVVRAIGDIKSFRHCLDRMLQDECLKVRNTAKSMIEHYHK